MPTDVRSSKAKLVASIPEDSTKWLQVLKRFTNLLFLLFTPSSPLYVKMLDIVKAIWTYPPEVITQLPMHAKASILWIVHLHSRHYAQGKMVLNAAKQVECLPAFSQMYNSICSANIHTVSVAGLPAKLNIIEPPKVVTPDKRKEPEQPEDLDENKSKKKRKKQKELPWNKKLKSALAGPLKTAKNPGFS